VFAEKRALMIGVTLLYLLECALTADHDLSRTDSPLLALSKFSF
jgi:hypothetical protein